MKKTFLLSAILLLSVFSQSAVAQTRHYRYAYCLHSDGTRKADVYSQLAKEYSITYSSTGIYFSTPTGSSLGSSFLLNYDNGNMGCSFLSNNTGAYQGSTTLKEFNGETYNKYDIPYTTSCYLSGYGSTTKSEICKVFISEDAKTLVLVWSEYFGAVYTQVSSRSIQGHVSMSSSNNSGSNSYNGNNNSNNNSSNSSDGVLVGSYQALGLIDGGSSRTDYFSVYKDNQGRYYVNLPSCSHNLMHSNTNSTYLGYNVSMYNYWFYDSYTRTYWYIRL